MPERAPLRHHCQLTVQPSSRGLFSIAGGAATFARMSRSEPRPTSPMARTYCRAISYQGGPLQQWAVRYYDQHVLLPTPKQLAVSGHKTGSRMDSMRRRLGKETS